LLALSGLAVSDLLLFLVVAGGLIFGHELGHFLVAQWRGVQIEEFGIGFPPRLATLFYWHGTRISLNFIPFGAFVRPAGEDDPSVPGGLSASSKTTRTLVLLAGPATNILLGFLAFSAAFRFAAPDPDRVLITDVATNSPAAEAGILPGDIVLRVDDQPITSFESMQNAILSRLDMPVAITVERNGQTTTVQLVPRSDPPEGQGAIGVFLGYPTKPVSLPHAVSLGGQAIAFQIIETFRLPARLLHGQVAPDQARLSGLKGMYDMLAWASGIDQSTRRPFVTLQLVGVISVGLAIANLLPIPALDGGRLMFVVYEAIFRRRIAPRHEGLAHAIGFTLLLVLMVYVTIQDFVNPIALPR
jgi:regulator of sigma E protease